MCDFCNSLTNGKKITWAIRSHFADDNVQDFLDSKFYDEEYIETDIEHGFKLTGYLHEGNVRVSVESKQEYTNNKGDKIVSHPFTEGVQFNFCPFCGEQISKNAVKFEDCIWLER